MRGDIRKFLRGGMGGIWWLGYYLDGEEKRESTGLRDEAEAEKVRKRREKELHVHELVGGDFRFLTAKDKKKTANEAAEVLERDFKQRGKLSPQNASNLRKVKAAFGHRRLLSLKKADFDEYKQNELDKGYKEATINRVLQLLQQANLAAKLPRLEIEMLPENNTRQGFFETPDITEVMKHLGEDLADYVRFDWITGMRKGEAASLRWSDMDGDVIRLRGEDAKTGEPRSLPIEGDDLVSIMKRRKRARAVKREDTVEMCELIFHREGQRIKEFRKSWARACCLAGVGAMFCRECDVSVNGEHTCPQCGVTRKYEDLLYKGKIFHDLRRTALRNMVRGGASQHVAMSLTGHKTDSTFRRYDITDVEDQRDALRKSERYRVATARRRKIARIR